MSVVHLPIARISWLVVSSAFIYFFWTHHALVGKVWDLLLYKCEFLLEMAKELEKYKEIAKQEEEEEEYILLELDDCHYSCIYIYNQITLVYSL